MKRIALVFFSFLLLCSFYGEHFIFAELDPYRWLEETESEQTRAWLVQQDVVAEAYFSQEKETKDKLKSQLRSIRAFDTFSTPLNHAKGSFYLRQLKGESQASLYFAEKDVMTHILVNPMDICREGTVSITGFEVSPDGTKVAYGLSMAGSDWNKWKIHDVLTHLDLEDELTHLKFSEIIWDADGQGLFYFGHDASLQNDFSEKVMQMNLYYHKLGTSSESDRLIYQNNDRLDLCFTDLTLTEDNRFLCCCFQKGTSTFNGFMYRDQQNIEKGFIELLPDTKGEYSFSGYKEGRFFFVTNDGAPRGKVISIDPLNPAEENWVEHIKEQEFYLVQASLAADSIVIVGLKDAYSQIKVFDKAGALQFDVPLPGMGTAGFVFQEKLLAGYSNGDFFFPYMDYTRPFAVFKGNVHSHEVKLQDCPEVSWSVDDFITKQVFYTSKDGTSIPLFIIHHRSVKPNKDQPLLLSGYGGFGLSITPSFDALRLAWLQNGGIYAFANIRGGGEYGELWHQSGMLQNKQNVFDDFISAAEWLIKNEYTSSEKLAITGTSNGGLLVGGCITQRPDLFRAAIPKVGVLDMLRFHLFTVGWAWIPEYGCADNPEHFSFLYSYSPYHQVKAGTKYPSTLIVTGDHDDRVVPMHSFKFAAALQEAQGGENPIILKVYRNTGHGFGKSMEQRIDEDAESLTFLLRELGCKK